jgi:Crp-like helix-turn-helix protein
MTHEFISKMLGVRREGVSHVAKDLQRQSLISYARGQIKIIDRRGLESCACECYAVVKEEHDRLRRVGEEDGRLLIVDDRRRASRRIGSDRRAPNVPNELPRAKAEGASVEQVQQTGELM